MDHTFWQGIVDADFAVPTPHTIADLTPELLSLLSSPDPHLRDALGYPILAAWILRGRFSTDALRAMAMQLADNLRIGLGEQGTDTVFLRAFSALVVAVIVYHHNQEPFLKADEVRSLLEQALAYYPAEQDLRGYIPGPGWAHAVAHGADLLRMLAETSSLDAQDLERIMDALAAKIAPPVAHVYLYNEDQRIIRAVLSVLKRNLLSPLFLSAWLDRLTHYQGGEITIKRFLGGEPPLIASEIAVSVMHNTRQFLFALYVHLTQDEQKPASAADFAPLVLAALQPLNVG